MLKRVKKAYSEEENSPGITLKDYLNFYQVRLILLCMSKPLNILPKGGGTGIHNKLFVPIFLDFYISRVTYVHRFVVRYELC